MKIPAILEIVRKAELKTDSRAGGKTPGDQSEIESRFVADLIISAELRLELTFA